MNNIDTEAFKMLVDPYLHRFMIGIHRILEDRSDAREALERGLQRIWAELPFMEDRSSFFVWAYRQCIDQALGVRRSRMRRRECSVEDLLRWLHGQSRRSEEQSCESSGESPVAGGEEQTWSRIREVFGMLTEDQRDVFILRDLDGQNTGDVARILKISSEAVRRDLCLARFRIRQAFSAVGRSREESLSKSLEYQNPEKTNYRSRSEDFKKDSWYRIEGNTVSI